MSKKKTIELRELPDLKKWKQQIDYLTLILTDDGQSNVTMSDGKRMQILRVQNLKLIHDEIQEIKNIIHTLIQYVLAFENLHEMEAEIDNQLKYLNRQITEDWW